MQQNITILSGSKGCGKTTALLDYCKTQKNIAGILTPIINNKRCFYNISSQEIFDMEFANEMNDKEIKVGKYVFSSNAFCKANNILQSINISNTQIVIDEIGYLELNNEGFANTLKQLLQKGCNNLLLVVRDGLVNDVITYFELKNVKIVTKDYFLTA